MLKVLHAADVHLDSPFTKENIRLAEMRRGEQRAAFVDLMMYARENGVQLLLLPGDLFDHLSPAPQTVEMFERELRAAAERGCEIFIAPGNHDPYVPGGLWDKLDLPENVHIFRSEQPEAVDLPDLGVTVWGYCFKEGSVPPDPFAADYTFRPDRMNILLAHADLYSASGDCPVTTAEIRASGFDYVALGHIHKGSGLRKEGDTYYAYPGCLEGRDFGECGEKGALLALMEKKEGVFKMEATFRRFSKRRYEQTALDVTGMESTEQVTEALSKAVKEQGYGEDTLLRTVFTGRAKPALRLHGNAFRALSDRLCQLEVKDQTFPEASEEDLAGDPTVRGEFYRLLLPLFREGTDAEKEQAALALRFGLAALDGNDVTTDLS